MCSDVTSQVDKIKIKLDQFQHLVKNSNTATSNEFKELKKRITRDIKKVDKDVDGLNGAVTQVWDINFVFLILLLLLMYYK